MRFRLNLESKRIWFFQRDQMLLKISSTDSAALTVNFDLCWRSFIALSWNCDLYSSQLTNPKSKYHDLSSMPAALLRPSSSFKTLFQVTLSFWQAPRSPVPFLQLSSQWWVHLLPIEGFFEQVVHPGTLHFLVWLLCFVISWTYNLLRCKLNPKLPLQVLISHLSDTMKLFTSILRVGLKFF